MALETLPLLLLLAATLLGAAASLLAVVFKRPGSNVLDLRVSTLALLRNPGRYVRKPYARVVQTLGVAALVLGFATILSFMVWQVLR